MRRKGGYTRSENCDGGWMLRRIRVSSGETGCTRQLEIGMMVFLNVEQRTEEVQAVVDGSV